MKGRARGGRRAGGPFWGGGLALALSGCNAIFGIDDASVAPGGAAGDSGAAGGAAGGASGAAGEPGPGGRAGGGAAGAAGASGGGGAASRLFDRSFGEGGLAAFSPFGVHADAYTITGLRVQPSGLPLVAARAALKVRDYMTYATMASAFVTRLTEAGGVDASFGALGYVMSKASTFSRDDDGRLFFDPFTGTPLFDVEGDQCEDGCYEYGQLILSNVDGQGVLRVERSDYPFANAVLFSSKGCFVLDGQVYFPPTEPPAPPLPARYLAVSPCGGSWAPTFETSAAVALPAFADDVVVHDPARLDPVPSGENRFLVPVVQASTGSVGAFEIEHGGGIALTMVATAGGVGHLLVKPDALDAALPRAIDALAFDAAAGRAYFAGTAARADGTTEPFLARVRYADGALDASLGEAGTTGRWACLAIDARGRPLVAGRRNGESVAARFDAEGRLDLAFAPGGYLKLPFEPQACALDAAGRLLVVGAGQTGYGARVFGVRLLNRDDAAALADEPPATPGPTACTAADDRNEPNDVFEAASVVPGSRYKCLPTTWSSLFVNETDVDWFGFPGPGDCPYTAVTTHAEVTVAEAAATVEACVYLDTAALPPATVSCPSGVATTLGDWRGCCGVGTAKLRYYAYDLPDQAITPDNLKIRVTPQAFAQRCDVYQVSLTLSAN